MKNIKWVMVHRLEYLIVDEDGISIDGKIYDYIGDHSSFCDGIDIDKDLVYKCDAGNPEE